MWKSLMNNTERQQSNRVRFKSPAVQRGLSLGLSLTITAVIVVFLFRGEATKPPETWWTGVDDAQTILQGGEVGSAWHTAGEFSFFGKSKGYLCMDTRTKSFGHLVLNKPSFDNKVGSTAEIRLKALATPTQEINGFAFSLLDGHREGKIAFRKEQLLIADMNEVRTTYKVNTHDFHTYRLTLVDNDFKVYIDGELAKEITLTHQVTWVQRLQFGDFSGEPNTDTRALVDYIAYYTGGAIPPGMNPPP